MEENMNELNDANLKPVSGGSVSQTADEAYPLMRKYTCPKCGATIWVSGPLVGCKECGASWSLL